jgi:GPI-GlcNAc transferase complex, PIG-H component
MRVECRDVNVNVREYIVRAPRNDGEAKTPRRWHWCDLVYVLAILACGALLRPLHWLCVSLSLLLCARLGWRLSTVYEERLLVIRGVGIQKMKRFVGGWTTRDFFEHTKINAVLINEGIQLWRVLYYIIFIVDDGPKGSVASKTAAAVDRAKNEARVRGALLQRHERERGREQRKQRGNVVVVADQVVVVDDDDDSAARRRASLKSMQASANKGGACSMAMDAVEGKRRRRVGQNEPVRRVESAASIGSADRRQRVVMAFEHLLPRLNELLPIMRGTRAILNGS